MNPRIETTPAKPEETYCGIPISDITGYGR